MSEAHLPMSGEQRARGRSDTLQDAVHLRHGRVVHQQGRLAKEQGHEVLLFARGAEKEKKPEKLRSRSGSADSGREIRLLLLPELGQEEEGRQRNSQDWVRSEPGSGARDLRGGSCGRYVRATVLSLQHSFVVTEL